MAITDSTTPVTTDPVATPNTATPEDASMRKLLDVSLDTPKTEAPAANNDRLKAEDELAKKETVVPVAQPTTVTAPQTTETIDANLPKTPLQNDMQLIQGLQANEIPAKTTVEPVKQAEQLFAATPTTQEATPAVQEVATPTTPAPAVTEATPAPTTMNIDAILNNSVPTPAPTTIPTQETKPMPGFPPMPSASPSPSPTPSSLITNTSAVTQTAIPKAPIAKNKNIKIALFAILFVALGFTTYFIITTMYPLGLFATNTEPTPEPIVETGVTLSGDVLSGDILTDSGTVLALASGTVLDSGHASADDQFADLDDILSDTGTTTPTPSINVETLVVQLGNYQNLGTEYLKLAKGANDVQSMKLALYLSKQAPSLLNKVVENTNTISTIETEINETMAKFEEFLGKLKAKYGEIASGTGSTSQEANTGDNAQAE